MKGDSMVLGSNKSGWLQTFLSYMSTFMMLKKSLSHKVCFVLSLLMYSSYKSLYLLLRVQGITCSIFSGSCFSTSLFILLKRKGLRMLWSFCTTVMLRDWLWLMDCEKGFENHSLKSCWLLKMLGIKKCMRDHNSITSFCRGVPVRSNLRFVLNLKRVCHL